MTLDAGKALDRVEEPGFSSNREIEAAVAVSDDVESRRLLRVDDRGDRVEILLAKQRLAECRLERTTIQAEIEP